MAAFVRKKYESDEESVHSIRVSKVVSEVSGNTEPAADVDNAIKPKITKGNREFGIRPRYVTIGRTLTAGSGATAEEFVKRAKIPILTKAIFNGNTFSLGSSVTYKGSAWTVVARSPEDY